MKLSLLLILSVLFVACNETPTEDPAKTVINTDIADQEESTTQPDTEVNDQKDSDQEESAQEESTLKPENQASGFVEDNNACICTKEYAPVCGSDGITYPSGCQAGCADITEFTTGPCEN